MLTTNSPAYARLFDELEQKDDQVSDAESSTSQRPPEMPAEGKKATWCRKWKQKLLKK